MQQVIKCRFGFHNWTKWEENGSYINQRNTLMKIFQFRTCLCCGYIQQNCQTVS